jgi:hypothetical protein
VRARLTEVAAVVLAYSGVAIWATWPMAREPVGGFYGFGNDNLGGVWIYDWLHKAYLGAAAAGFAPVVQAPFGFSIPDSAIQPFDRLFALVLGGWDEGLGAYNAQIFSSFVLAGCTMYLLARYLTASRSAAGLAGLIFTLSPFHLAQAMQYGALASIQWIPLFVLAIVALLRTWTIRNAVLAGAAFTLVAAGSYYYAWFAVWFAVAVFVVFLAHTAIARRAEKRGAIPAPRPPARTIATRVAVAALVAALLAGPLVVGSLRAATAAEKPVTRPLTEAIRYSGHPWMLFLPPHDNPLFGDVADDWILTHQYDSPVYEESLYLGYTALVLAAIAFAGRRRLDPPPAAASFARPLLLAGGGAALLILIGPYVPLDREYWRLWSTPDQTTHVPSLGLLMFKLVPVFRFFSRAYVLVSVCLAALAAIGFARLESRLGSSPARRGALVTVAAALVVLEYSNAPPRVWTPESTPAWVAEVARLPRHAAIAEYPLAPVNSPRSLYYLFWQRKHDRATVNPADSPEAESFATRIMSVDDPGAGAALHEAGIDFVLVHTKLPPQTTPPYQPALSDDSMPANAGALNPWLALMRRSNDVVIYRVLNRPRGVAGVVARASAGFGLVEPEGGTRARWLEGPVGEIDVFVIGARRRVTISLTLASFSRPRTVSARVDGRPVVTVTVAPGYTTYAVELGRLRPGRHVVTLKPSPGVERIGDVLGNGDPRRVSLRLREEPYVLRQPSSAR